MGVVIQTCSVPNVCLSSFSAAVKVQRSEQPHRWDPCMSSCHSPRPGHCRTPTWATPASQDQNRCKVPSPLSLSPIPREGLEPAL